MHEEYWFEILGGILIVVSSLVGEEMHRRLKWAAYFLFVCLALVYSLFGIFIARAAEKREADAEAEAKESRVEAIKAEKELIQAQQQIIAKSDEIIRLNRELSDSVTGGDEFAYLQPQIADDQQQHRLFLIVAHRGKYPIYDVGFRVLDFRRGGTQPLAAEMLSNTFNVGNLAPKQLHFVAYWPLIPGKTHYGFNFFFTARNAAGFVQQQLRYVRVGEKWLSATEVTPYNSRKVLYIHADVGFPKNGKGEIDWNDDAYQN